MAFSGMEGIAARCFLAKPTGHHHSGSQPALPRLRRVGWVACAAMMRVGSGMRVQDSDISTQCHDWVYIAANTAAKYTQ